MSKWIISEFLKAFEINQKNKLSDNLKVTINGDNTDWSKKPWYILKCKIKSINCRAW